MSKTRTVSTRKKIIDFISSKEINATPEEIDAVQPFSKKLVELYNYPKEYIRTRPQFRVKSHPSDKIGYPVDIIVFSKEEHDDNNACIIVECKAKTELDGRKQLELYLKFSNANLGVWYNGDGFLAIRKYENKGRVDFVDIPDIPKYGERLEDIGKYKRKNLLMPHSLIDEFKGIRNYLAGNAKKMTNDASFAQEVINIILCKLYDEKYTPPNDVVRFRAGFDEPYNDVAKRVKELFKETKEEYSDVFESSDKIKLDSKSITYMVGKLQKFTLLNAERDAVGQAFQVFIGPSLRGAQGQFFTPRNVVRTVIEIIKPKIGEKIIDPACGSGGFLVECLKHIHIQIDEKGKKLGWNADEIRNEKVTKIDKYFRGIEKDEFLTKVAKAYMIILCDGKSGIWCEDALDLPQKWSNGTKDSIEMNTFDIVITNPPFGSDIPVRGHDKLSQYDLCHKWSKDDGVWQKGKVLKSQTPQIAFIDRCLDLLKDGGRMGIVLPDGVLSNGTTKYIRHSISQRAEIIGIVDLPMSTFLPSTPTKTHLLFIRKKSKPNTKTKLFMSYAKTCGHDKRGKKIDSDDVKSIPTHLKNLEKNKVTPSKLGTYVMNEDLQDYIWLPKYYNPEFELKLKSYEKNNYIIKSFKDLVDEKIISISSGNEISSVNYGLGDIPFIRTSEIGNLEVIADPVHCTSEEVYNKYKKRQNIQNEDILLVTDGTYLMGRSAMITDLDIKIILQSHIEQIKVIDKTKLSPYLLLAIINFDVVQRQIESKSFRQSTISTLGNRLKEVKLPIPKDEGIKNKLIKIMHDAITSKRNAKNNLSDVNINSKLESLIGIKNRSSLGNL